MAVRTIKQRCCDLCASDVSVTRHRHQSLNDAGTPTGTASFDLCAACHDTPFGVVVAHAHKHQKTTRRVRRVVPEEAVKAAAKPRRRVKKT